MNITETSLVALRDKISRRELSATEVVSSFLERTEKTNSKINAMVEKNPKALERAEWIDKEIKNNRSPGPLAGIPVAVKDNYCTDGIRTTASSKILKNFVPPYSATVVEKLERAGAIVIGKANCDEFAMGSTNENSAFGNVKNPWNLDYVPGGSSGGSAAAVAAGMAPVGLGTDTGGSIRLPSSYCSLVGIKPTYGRVSRYGIVAFSSSLDQAGPMARTVKDCALVLEHMSGWDVKDSTSSEKKVPQWFTDTKSDVSKMTIGLPREYFVEGVDKEIKTCVEKVIDSLKSKGAKFVDVTLPLTKHSVSTYYIVATSEASSNLARYDGVRYGHRAESTDLDELYKKSRGEGFGEEVKRRIMIGTFALSSGYYDAYYKKACQIRRLIQNDFKSAFSKCDVILGPVSTSPVFKIGEKVHDPLKMYLNDIFTTSVNLAGLPGMSVPAGFDSKGMPIGVQIIGSAFEEQKMFDVALAVEESAKVEGKVARGI